MAERELNVLLLDDDQAQRAELQKMLAEIGCRVRIADEPELAQRAIANDPPELLVAAARTIESDGWELCRWLRSDEFARHIYLLAIVDRADRELAVAALEAGADEVAFAGLEASELAARLRVMQRSLEREESLRAQAKCDTLTGLATAAVFGELLEKEWSRSRRYGLPLSCVSIDLDGFADVLNQGGQTLANESLRRIGQLLSKSCRTSDLVCRRGDDRYLVLLPETDEKNGALWAERVRARIAALALDEQSEPLTVTCSVGVAQRLEDTQNGKELIDLADQALEVAKRSGRNRVVAAHSLAAHQNVLAPSSIPSLFGSARAEERMIPLSYLLTPSTSALEAARTLLASGLGTLPVADEAGNMVGVVSERDLLVLQIWPEWRDMPVGNVMQRNVVAYDAATPIKIIYEFLCRVSIRSVIVTSGRRPVGLLSRRDLLLSQLDAPAEPTLAPEPAQVAGIPAPTDEPFPWFPPGCAPELLQLPTFS